jgi:probable phosphoglycerate mutase
MTLFHLVRHGSHGLLGRTLTGRMAGVNLSDHGRAEAAALAARLTGGIAAIYSSPLERTVQTAEEIATRLELPVRVEPRLTEVDFGRWSGLSFDTLRDEKGWSEWNSFRSAARAPDGETIVEVQARIVAAMVDLRDRHGDRGVVLVSHGDVIKSALAYWAGIPLDLLRRIEISPASISKIALGERDVTILGINEQPAPP